MIMCRISGVTTTIPAPSLGRLHKDRMQKYRHRAHLGVDRADVPEPGGNPRRLSFGQDVGARIRLDLEHTLHDVLELVQIVGVPCGGERFSLVDERPCGWTTSLAHVDQHGLVR
jgi:hypothetical protein